MTLTLQQRVLKTQVWVIVKILIHFLNPIVTTCVMNQSKGDWLLLDALATIINLIVVMEFEANPLVDANETFDLFVLSFIC